jgi:hypothetical protein
MSEGQPVEKGGEGPFGLYLPVKYEVTLEKIPDSDKWQMHYAETFDSSLPEEKMEKGMQNIQKLFGSQLHLDGHKISLQNVDTLEHLASGLVGEFLTVSPLGKLTVGELFLLAMMASGKIEDKLATLLKEAVEKGEIDLKSLNGEEKK